MKQQSSLPSRRRDADLCEAPDWQDHHEAPDWKDHHPQGWVQWHHWDQAEIPDKEGSIWFLRANSCRMAAISQTTILRKNLPYSTWCFTCRVTSLGPLSTSLARRTTLTRWSATRVTPTCTPALSTAVRSAAIPTTCAPRLNKAPHPPPQAHQEGFCPNPAMLGPQQSFPFINWRGKKEKKTKR